jgi:hypothetical protein
MQESTKLIIISFLIYCASRAHAFLVVSPPARPIVVRQYSSDTEGSEEQPFLTVRESRNSEDGREPCTRDWDILRKQVNNLDSLGKRYW